MRINIFNKKQEPAEQRCNGCCNNCPASALKCDKGRKKLGIPESTDEGKTEE